ncbi:MAG: hypothetical protein AAGJ40_24100 [Planctomycetota bacterium]
MTLRQDQMLALLDECQGDDLWSLEHCRSRGVPDDWIDRLADAYETSYRISSETIYVADEERGRRVVNQYHGIRDVDLAMQIGRLMGVDVDQLAAISLGRRALVARIKEAILED